MVVIGVSGYFFVNTMQQPTGVANTADSARIRTSWVWRSPVTREPDTPSEECDMRKPWGWFFVDFGRPRGEPVACRISQ